MPLEPEVREKLEQRGVDSVRALLISHTGSGRGAAVTVDNGIYASRSDVEDWLREKERTSASWIKAGTIAAIVAAVLAFLAVVIAVLAWMFPRGL
jgi:hypothetical protein